MVTADRSESTAETPGPLQHSVAGAAGVAPLMSRRHLVLGLVALVAGCGSGGTVLDNAAPDTAPRGPVGPSTRKPSPVTPPAAGTGIETATPTLPPSEAALPDVTEPSTSAGPPKLPTGIEPVRIEIPSIGVDADIIRLDIRGVPEVPENFAEVGWYDQTRLPGEIGPAVLAGHIDSKSGPAVFYRLQELKPGDEITVHGSQADVRSFIVTGSGQYSKEALPSEVFGFGEPEPELRVITCGGTFDRDAGHYRDNYVVYARAVNPVSRASNAASRSVDAQIRYGPERDHFGQLHVPDAAASPAPIFVLIHGGFWAEPWDYTLMTPIQQALAAEGFATWNIEFRRVDGDGGHPATFDDVIAAINHLAVLAERFPIDLDRVVLVGHSSGGHLALWARGAAQSAGTARVKPQAAVGLAAVTDPALFTPAHALLGATPDERPDLYAYASPVFDHEHVTLVHGENDRIVPVSTIANAESAGVPVTIIDGADHFDLIDTGSPAWPQVMAALRSAVPGF